MSQFGAYSIVEAYLVMCQTRGLFVFFILLAIPLGASEPFFPMQPGNFWEYRTPDGAHSFRVRGFVPLSANGRVYYFVNGFAPGQLTVREEIGEGLKTYDSETGMESLFTLFSQDGNPQFNAPDRGCGIVTGKVEPNRVAGSLPTGDYPRMLQITYDTPACEAPVVQSESFVANIGMVQRVMKVGNEIRQYDLISARVGGQVILSKNIANVTALTWQQPQSGDAALRFRLETMPSIGAITSIHYGTTQRYDLVIRDQSGKKMWQYSDGKAFLQIIGQANAASFDISVPLDQLPGKSIAPGLYTVDAWLTTAGENPRFAASITVVVGDFGQPPLALSGAVNRSVMRGRGGLPIPGRSQRY